MSRDNSTVIGIFERMFYREPTRKELEEIYAMLGKEHDNPTVLQVVMTFYYLQKRVENSVEEMNTAVDKKIADTEKEASRHVYYTIQDRLEAVVANACEKAKASVSGRTFVGWICATVMVFALAVGGLHLLTSSRTYNAGYRAGVADTEIAERKFDKRAEWAQTPTGKLAYAYDMDGALTKILNCTVKGFKISFHPENITEQVCWTGDVNKSTYWRMPQNIKGVQWQD